MPGIEPMTMFYGFNRDSLSMVYARITVVNQKVLSLIAPLDKLIVTNEIEKN
jgi:hypothetical protein